MLFLSLEERAWLIQLKNLNCERKDLIIEFPLDSDMDLDQLIIDIPQQTYECFIYKVPPALRKVNHDAYTPMLISIGPFHHKDEKLKNMEELKLRYFKGACHRTKKSAAELARCIKKEGRNYSSLSCRELWYQPYINID